MTLEELQENYANLNEKFNQISEENESLKKELENTKENLKNVTELKDKLFLKIPTFSEKEKDEDEKLEFEDAFKNLFYGDKK